MKLATLRSRLNQLRRRRAMVRQSTAWSAVALAGLWLVTAAFLVDWLLLMSVPQRLVAWGIGLSVAGWAFWRYTRPWLGVKEDVVDVALLVEKHQHIDSDLVAALQFQETNAADWGSPQLESAVIEYVEEFSPSLNVFEGFTYRRFKRRLAWLAGTLAVLLGAAALFPDHAGAFANRMLLGSMRYPTDTKIERIAINGETVYLADGEKVPLRLAYGTPLDFEVRGTGRLPEKGVIRLKTKDSENEVEVELNRGLAGEPVKATDPAFAEDEDLALPSSSVPTKQRSANESEMADETGGQAVYQGRLPRLVGSVTYQAYLGDTWTDPLEIEVIPLPVVTVSLDPQPPRYAIQGDEEAGSVREGTRQIAVIEGTSVALDLESSNKPLAQARLTVEGKNYPLEKVDQAGKSWRLAGPNSPLDRIRQPVRYAIQVEDEDGLPLEHPIEGYIRIRADRKPRIQPPVLEVSLVRPTAVPPIDYSVSDDYGLSRLALNVQVVRKIPMENEEDGMRDDVDHVTWEIREIPSEEQPIRSLAESYPLDLSPMKLNPGDELKVTLEAFDYRGEFAPQSSISEPLVLKVTDAHGVSARVEELDKKSAQSIDRAIETISGDKK